MMVRLYAILIVMVALIPVIGLWFAGEYNEKPVMCGSQIEILDIIDGKKEVLMVSGKQLTKVRDPDEGDGLSDIPAILPFAFYTNVDTGTYTAIEYHGHPYDTYCVISYGVELTIGEIGE